MEMDDQKIEIAVIGRFQIGKSSLINCLLGRSAAKVGNGWKSETPTCVTYALPEDILLNDTPGFDDKETRDKDAEEAIKRADFVVFVKDNNRSPDEVDLNWVHKCLRKFCPCLFVVNCVEGDRNRARHWNPRSDFNAQFCEDIQKEFITKNGFDMFVKIGGQCVLPVNACWAQYGLGVLEDEEKVEDVEDWLRHAGVRETDFKDEALEQSNFSILREFIESIRMELLTHFLYRKDQVVRCLVDSFCEEFTKRLSRKSK